MFGLMAAALAAPQTLTFDVVGSDEKLEIPVPSFFEDADFDARVVGGEPAQAGQWDDAVGVVFEGAYVGCTGTLVAPNVALTAAHCAGGITHVVVGTKDWTTNQGEAIEVRNTRVHPTYDGFNGYDIAVLNLRGESTYPPRTLALDCVLDEDLYDGAPVTIAGFGNTRQDGGGATTRLMVADNLVRDADCSQNRIDGIYTGCLEALRPAGEIAAGGRVDIDGDGTTDQSDACFGDSGGPLYLNTPRGSFLIGVTSRAFIGVEASRPCRDGGIWVRPDAVLNFIENQSGVTMARPQCNEAPVVNIDPFDVRPGKWEAQDLDVDDPDGSSFSLEVLDEPSLGILSVSGDQLVFEAYKGVEGSETVRVAVTDDGNPAYPDSPPNTVELDVPITVRPGAIGRACGCSSNAAPTFGIAILVGVLALFRRRF